MKFKAGQKVLARITQSYGEDKLVTATLLRKSVFGNWLVSYKGEVVDTKGSTLYYNIFTQWVYRKDVFQIKGKKYD